MNESRLLRLFFGLATGFGMLGVAASAGCTPAPRSPAIEPTPAVKTVISSPLPLPTATPLPIPTPTQRQVIQTPTSPPATAALTATLPTISTSQRPYTTRVQVSPTQTVQVNYLLYLPGTYGQDASKQWPLILFLHGRGERGSNLDLLKNHPLPKILESQTDFPFIVISPQHSLDELWWSDMINPLDKLLDQIEAQYAVDPQRVYLTGLSMGGFGAWEYALRYPHRFAAVVPIAGGWIEGSHALPANICDLKDLPIWAFYGGLDEYVSPFQTEILVKAVQACGGRVRVTFYPDADHASSWNRAYAQPELYRWLLEQSLK